MNVELIYTVSEIDREIIMLQREVNDKTIPEKLSREKNMYSSIKAEYDNLNSSMEVKAAALKALSEKNEALLKEAKELEGRLYNSSNLKIIEAMQHTLNKLSNEIDSNEISVYAYLEEQENDKQRKEELRSKLSEISKSYNPVKNKYLEHIKALKEKIWNLSERKNSILSQLDKSIVNEYEAIRKSKGYGMSLLKGEICTGCGMSVSCIIISNARKHNDLQKCPNCGRFLYSKD